MPKAICWQYLSRTMGRSVLSSSLLDLKKWDSVNPHSYAHFIKLYGVHIHMH